MDLASLSPRTAAGETKTLHLRHPATGEPLMDGDKEVTIDLYGSDSQVLKDALQDIDRRKVSGEEISEEQAGAEKLVALIAGWSGIGLRSDKSLPFNRENALRLVQDPDALWIVEQIAPFSRNRRNFMKGTAGS